MICGVVATSISGCGVCNVCRVVRDSVVHYTARRDEVMEERGIQKKVFLFAPS
jgi:hypothetical protein